MGEDTKDREIKRHEQDVKQSDVDIAARGDIKAGEDFEKYAQCFSCEKGRENRLLREKIIEQERQIKFLMACNVNNSSMLQEWSNTYGIPLEWEFDGIEELLN